MSEASKRQVVQAVIALLAVAAPAAIGASEGEARQERSPRLTRTILIATEQGGYAATETLESIEGFMVPSGSMSEVASGIADPLVPSPAQAATLWSADDMASIADSVAIDDLDVWGGWSFNDARVSAYPILGDGTPDFEFLAASGVVQVTTGVAAAKGADRALFLELDPSNPPLGTPRVHAFSSESNGVPDWSFAAPATTFIEFPSFRHVAVSHDGSTAAVQVRNALTSLSTLYVFNAATGDLRTTWTDSGFISAVELTDDGSRALVTQQSLATVLDTATGDVVFQTTGAFGEIHYRISGDGNVFVVCGFEIVRVYAFDGTTYQQVIDFTRPGHWFGQATAVSRDGSTVGTFGTDENTNWLEGEVFLFDVATGALLGSQAVAGSGSFQGTAIAAAASDDGSVMAFASWGTEHRNWPEVMVFNRDVELIGAIHFPGSAFAVDVSADGRYVVGGAKAVHANVDGAGGRIELIEIDWQPGDNPLPLLADTTPNAVVVGSEAIVLTASGSFQEDSVVRFGGTARPTTFVDENTLTAQIPASDLDTVGVFPVTVFTPAPGGGESGPRDFQVLALPPPEIEVAPASLSSILASGGTETQTLTIANTGADTALEWEVTEEGTDGTIESVTPKAHRPALPSRGGVSAPFAPPNAIAGDSSEGVARSWTDPGRVPHAPDRTVRNHSTGVFGSLTFYNDRGDFQTANPGLILEDFSETNVPPDSAAACPPPFDSGTDNACFSPGAIAPGLSMSVVDGGGQGQAVVLTPPLAGVPCVSVGPDSFIDHADWELDPPALAVGFDLQSDLPGQVFTATVFGPAGHLGSTEVMTAGIGAPVFFGVETSDPLGIRRIEVRGPGEQAELFCDVEFGGETVPLDCTLPDWVSPLPTSGSVPAGQEQVVDVAFDTAGLSPGDFTANLCLTSNDPAHALTVVPLSLTVTDGGDEGFTPMALAVDAEERVSDGNDIFEPSELVDVAPSWLNDGETAQSLMGEASTFTGPAGADYELANGSADYGLIEPDATASCLDSGVCYRMGLDDPATRPATHWDARFDETLDDTEATIKTWSLHIGASFTDVPPSNLFYPAIETLLHHGVTGGCSADAYCPAGSNTRGQMAVFLLKAALGGDHLPPACVEDDEAFDDVPFDSLFCPWIEELSSLGITSGCGGGNYCPADTVTRAQMAIFLLKAAEGGGYTPPPCAGEFGDVPCSSPFAAWIEELAARGVTAGCADGNYCPADAVTRAQMAVFVTKTFGLTLYGP